MMRLINDTETLARFVTRLMEEGDLTLRDVEENSKRGGLKGITKTTIGNIKNGDHTNLSTAKLKALAKGLNTTFEEVLAVVRGQSGNLEKIVNERFARIADGYSNLTDKERENIEMFLQFLEKTIRDSEIRRETEEKNQKLKDNKLLKDEKTVTFNDKEIKLVKESPSDEDDK